MNLIPIPYLSRFKRAYTNINGIYTVFKPKEFNAQKQCQVRRSITRFPLNGNKYINHPL